MLAVNGTQILVAIACAAFVGNALPRQCCDGQKSLPNSNEVDTLRHKDGKYEPLA
jgi:hypothetical protein